MEASGVVVALPTDEATLNNADYKKRNFKVGDKVAVVRNVLLTDSADDSRAPHLTHSTTMVHMPNTLPFHGSRPSRCLRASTWT